MSDKERARAAALGQSEWGTWGSANDHRRYAQLLPGRYRNRRRCRCGCGGRETHTGMTNGLALTGGCELSVRRWVRDGYPPSPVPPVPGRRTNHEQGGRPMSNHPQVVTSPGWHKATPAAPAAPPLTPAEAATVGRFETGDAAPESLRERVARALWEADYGVYGGFDLGTGEADLDWSAAVWSYRRLADAALRVVTEDARR